MIFDKMGVVKWDRSFEVNFKAFFKKWFDFCNYTTSGKRIEFDREITKLINFSCLDISAIF